MRPLSASEHRLLENVKPYLGSEHPLAMVRGQTFVSPVVLPLVGSLLFFFLVKPRTVIVTERSVITVQESIWFLSKVVREVSRYRCGSVPVTRSRLGLRVGGDTTIFAMLGSFPAVERVIELASRPAA